MPANCLHWEQKLRPNPCLLVWLHVTGLLEKSWEVSLTTATSINILPARFHCCRQDQLHQSLTRSGSWHLLACVAVPQVILLSVYKHTPIRHTDGNGEGQRPGKTGPTSRANLPSACCQYLPPSTSNYQHGDSDCPRGPCWRTETQTNNRR